MGTDLFVALEGLALRWGLKLHRQVDRSHRLKSVAERTIELVGL